MGDVVVGDVVVGDVVVASVVMGIPGEMGAATASALLHLRSLSPVGRAGGAATASALLHLRSLSLLGAQAPRDVGNTAVKKAAHVIITAAPTAK